MGDDRARVGGDGGACGTMVRRRAARPGTLTTADREARMQLAWIAALVLAILVAAFALQNTTPVTISFLFWGVDRAALALVILASVGIGALITLLIGLPRFVRTEWRTRGLRRQVGTRDRRIAALETEPGRAGSPSGGATAAP